MKTILVATDFSDNARNAINYAVEIAKPAKAKLIIFHAFHIPVAPSDLSIAAIPFDEMEKGCMIRLKKTANEIQDKNKTPLNIECICKIGFAVDEINELVKTKGIDLVVMGIRGANILSEILIGSTTSALMKHGGCPVLVINENVKFKNIKKIVFACDYQKTPDLSTVNLLKEFEELFKSHVYTFNIMREMENVTSVNKAVAGVLLRHSLERVNHSFHFAEQEDVVDGINRFTDYKKADMIAMIPHKHNLFSNLFRERNTKKMAFHTHVPLLVLLKKQKPVDEEKNLSLFALENHL